MLPAEYGLRSRLGSREWVIGMTGAADNEVRSVLPFHGGAANGAGDKLFACTSSGIWDVTTHPPTLALAFAVTSGKAGHGVSHGMVTSAGHFLLYCDEENGYHVYSEASGLWAAVAMGGGAGEVQADASATPTPPAVDPANFCFVTVWKSRVWFVEKATARAWYLEAGSIYGDAVPFNFGLQFKAGGPLVGLWNWTADGGSGMDDHLVAVSGGGDVAVYDGTDPNDADTFGIRGVWSVGGVPAGRHLASRFGGDVLLLTKRGPVVLSQLCSGQDGQNTFAPSKAANLFNALMLEKSTMTGWSVHLHPEDNALIITVPTYEGQATEQLVQALWNRAWARYRELPIFSAAVWNGKLYYGTTDGKLGINDGYLDGRLLSDVDAYTPVQWALLKPLPSDGTQRRVHMLKPKFLAESAEPAFAIEARYGYDMTELAPVSGGVAGSSAWGSAVWGESVWGGGYTASAPLRGGSGMGADVAIAIRGQATGRTVLVGFDVAYETGGWL